MKKTITSVILTLSFFAFGAKDALAWPEINIPMPDLSGIAAAAEKIAKQEKCKGIKAKMVGSANSIKHACDTNYAKINAISTKLDSVIDKAGDKGYNVGKLKLDTNAYKDKVADFKQNCSYAYASLAFTSLANCMSNTPDDIISDLKTASGNFHSYNTKSKTSLGIVRDQYRNVIKVDLYNMSQQKYKE